MHCSQRAVSRKRGYDSPQTVLWKFGSAVPLIPALKLTMTKCRYNKSGENPFIYSCINRIGYSICFSFY